MTDTGPDPVRGNDEFRNDIFGVELDADFLAVHGFFAPWMVVRSKAEETPRWEFPPGAFRVVLSGAPHGIFDQVNFASI